MEEFLPLLQTYEIWIYILLGFAALFPLRNLIVAWREWQGTVFGLEREAAQHRFSTALTMLSLLILFVVLEFVIVSFVAPNYPQLAVLPTPTIDLLATPTVTLQVLVDGVQVEETQAVTPTVNMEVLQEGCIAGKIEWTFPAASQSVSAAVELTGTIDVENLGFYKYEYSKSGETIWNTVAAGNQIKKNEVIGVWDTSQLEPGDYLLRLVVMDNQNQLFPACLVPVKVVPK